MNNFTKNIKWLFINCRFIFPHVFLLTCISACISILSVYQAFVAKNIIDFALDGNLNFLTKYLILAISISLFEICISPILAIFGTYISTTFSNKLQKDLYEHIINSKYSEQSNYHSMAIISRLTSDIGAINNLIISIFPQIISLVFLLVSAFIALLNIKPLYAYIAIILFPFFLLLSKFYGKKQKEIYKEQQEKDIQYNTFIQESITNSMVLKAFCREKTSLNKLINIQKDKLKLSLKRTKVNSLANFLIVFGMNIGYLIVYVLGAIAICFGNVSIGSFTALIQLFNKVQGPIYSLATTLPQIITSLAAIERINELYTLNLEVKNLEITDNIKINKINFDSVSFSYNNKEKILDDINLNINPGDSLGIVGGSGEGKTTLLKLLLSLIEPNKGKIYINDDVVGPSHRHLISYVPQGNTLSSGTIEENLLYDINDISKSDLDAALEISCAKEFIEKFPNGLQTIVGEKGMGLSEGQAQRIAIARALLRKKPILILDEATSALDTDTEIKFLNNLKKLSYKPTTLVVTHRLSALENCNKIIKINKNKVTSI